MIRIVIENIVLFLLPTVAYFLYVYLRSIDSTGKPGEAVSAGRVWDDAPLIWLLVAGALMVLVVTFTFATFEGGSPGQKYVPPTMKDGHIVPGHFE